MYAGYQSVDGDAVRPGKSPRILYIALFYYFDCHIVYLLVAMGKSGPALGGTELITVLCSQPAGDVSHKPGGRLPLLSARPAVTPATLKRAATNFAVW